MITACGFVTNHKDKFVSKRIYVATVITACGFVTAVDIDQIADRN